MAMENDPHQWLEEVRSEKSLRWVKSKNSISEDRLLNDPRSEVLEKEIRHILMSLDRIQTPKIIEGEIYNFWQDSKNVRGLLRRTSFESYRSTGPSWETVLDVDQLAQNESENWVYSRISCLDQEHCLIYLSKGGGDAVVVREFNLKNKAFVANGFFIPESKSKAAWLDKDTLFFGPTLLPGSTTSSGYSREVRLLKRGEELEEAELLFQCDENDVLCLGFSEESDEKRISLVIRAKSFYSDVTYLYDEGILKVVPKPDSASVIGVFGGELLVSLREHWLVDGFQYPSGSVVSLPLHALAARPKILFSPTDRSSFDSVAWTKGRLYIFIRENAKSKLLSYQLGDGKWISEEVKLPGTGTLRHVSSDPKGDSLLVKYEDFLTPSSILEVNENSGSLNIVKLKGLPEVFDSASFKVQQLESTSTDGTKIPYFVVAKKGLTLDGKNPTLLYGYGGFEVSSNPFYLSHTGKTWLEKGGVYVLANIRGGGEFGPRWHQAALLEKRQNAFDDFISTAEDLITRKITNPLHLGIEGGSNGSLLVGTVMVQRPELFNAVLCEVPLLDMLRYHLLLAGASWMSEYGNPEDPIMREVLKNYSPYHTVRKDQKYPEIFLMTSTADDRVHPGHARKMGSLMEEQGHSFLYFENMEGGHGGAANLEQKVKQLTLSTTYLYQKLFHE